MTNYVVHACARNATQGTFVRVRAGSVEEAEGIAIVRMGWYKEFVSTLETLAITPDFGIVPANIAEANITGGFSGWSLADYQRSGDGAVTLQGLDVSGVFYRGGVSVGEEHAKVRNIIELLTVANAWAHRYGILTCQIRGLLARPATAYFGPLIADRSKMHKYGLPGRLILTEDSRLGTIWNAWARKVSA